FSYRQFCFGSGLSRKSSVELRSKKRRNDYRFHGGPIARHLATYEELLSIAMCVNGGSVRRVLNFLSCDHRPTGINSERRSGVRNRKNYGKNQQNRKARRLPRPRRTQTNRIRRQTKQRRKIR